MIDLKIKFLLSIIQKLRDICSIKILLIVYLFNVLMICYLLFLFIIKDKSVMKVNKIRIKKSDILYCYCF